MLLTLPSGFNAEVCSPTLRALLGGATLAEAALVTPELSAERLSEGDAFALSSWAARELADDPEAGAFAEVCEVFGCRPSRELGVTDAVLAFELDNAMVRAASPKPAPQPPAGESDTRVRFTTGGPE